MAAKTLKDRAARFRRQLDLPGRINTKGHRCTQFVRTRKAHVKNQPKALRPSSPKAEQRTDNLHNEITLLDRKSGTEREQHQQQKLEDHQTINKLQTEIHQLRQDLAAAMKAEKRHEADKQKMQDEIQQLKDEVNDLETRLMSTPDTSYQDKMQKHDQNRFQALKGVINAIHEMIPDPAPFDWPLKQEDDSSYYTAETLITCAGRVFEKLNSGIGALISSEFQLPFDENMFRHVSNGWEFTLERLPPREGYIFYYSCPDHDNPARVLRRGLGKLQVCEDGKVYAHLLYGQDEGCRVLLGCVEGSDRRADVRVLRRELGAEVRWVGGGVDGEDGFLYGGDLTGKEEAEVLGREVAEWL